MKQPTSRLLVTATVLAAGALVASCTTSSDPEPRSLPYHSVTVDGLTRTWDLYVPDGSDNAASQPMPVMLVVHGTGDSAAGVRSGIGPDLEELAESEGFVIAYVDGHANNWNECRAAGMWPAKEQNLDDVGFMRQVVASVGEELGPDVVDTERTFAMGFSSGGHMVQRLAFEAPDLVSGVAVVNANVPVDDNITCEDSRTPVPVIFIEGVEDTINPINGGEVVFGMGAEAVSRGHVRSAVDSADWFAERNGASAATDPVRDGDAEITDWPAEGPVVSPGVAPGTNPNAAPVRLITVDKSGHSFPTATGRWHNNNGARYDGPGAVWEFFAGL
ncbi:MAG: alpha/beta hydrolase family esterase [Corynebacterium variabile]